MKKIVITICIILILSSCALFSRRTHIIWPDKIGYIEALCDINMSWRDMRYSGSMSLKLKYPDRFRLEVYGPFGETAVYIEKNGEAFTFIGGDEKINDEQRFEERFGIKLNEFIDDIAMKQYRKNGPEGTYFQRQNYVVIYELNTNQNRICWKGRGGSICIKFLEAIFNEEG